MANFFNWLTGKPKENDGFQNSFNKALYEFMGGKEAQYDYKQKTYIEKGYGLNPDVYAVISQQSDKLNSIPYYVKEIDDKQARKQLQQLNDVTKGEYSIKQLHTKRKLETKAFKDNYKPFPLEQPNPNQTWSEIFALTKVFEQTCGNYFFYKVCPKDGTNKGVPQQMYILPSYLMKIVLKKDANLIETENVIDKYMLIEGNQFIEFETEDIIHVKLPNPFFDFDGGHLYGLSPMKVLLRNIESSNDALDQNVKTMKNGGVFGFIHAKEGSTMTAEQAVQLKEKMKEMDKDPQRLSKIAGASVPLAFTKISLTTEELKPFEFLSYDQKIICNVLQWDVLLLNNKESSTFDNLKTTQKFVILNHIMPRTKLLQDALNKDFIKLFPKYENCEIEWDYTELPEMQTDMKLLVEAYSNAPITPNEFREIIQFDPLTIDGMDTVYIDGGKKRIEDQGLSEDELNRAFNQ